MKKKYMTPEYINEVELSDVILVSIQCSEESDTITGIIDIEDLFG